jgi:hypothetical protein
MLTMTDSGSNDTNTKYVEDGLSNTYYGGPPGKSAYPG